MSMRAAEVLVVDDDAGVAETIAFILSDQGYSVRTASDGIEGLRCITELRPDVIVLDIEMPRLSGPGMAAAMLVENAGIERIPIVLVSGTVALKEVAEQVGTPYALAKPYSIEDLVGLVARALRELIAPIPKIHKGSGTPAGP
jgi:CheY-like chemotaxis protein